ncbi:MAG: hypothetical protein WBE91_11775 [Steroidobacteraceae bacterium]
MSETAENLPAPSNAPALVKYEAARQALAECSRVDECKEWSDKAAALAAYAKQAKDSTLHNLALRIQQRAQRRMGELLKTFPRGDEATRYGQEGAHPPVTRGQAASDAGLSEYQRKTAQRIASVPQVEFEAHVESAKPPTVTELARLGTATRMVPDPAPDVPPADPAAVSRAHRGLREFAAFCGVHDPVAIAHGSSGDADLLRGQVETISHWLDRFVVNLPSDEEAAA